LGYRIAKRGKYYWLFGRVKGVRLDSSLRTMAKKEAEEIAKAKVRRVLERVHGVRVIRNIKLGELLEKYFAYCEQNNRPNTVAKKRVFAGHILAFFGDVPLAAVTRERIEGYKAGRRGNVGPATVNCELALLKHALNLAVEWDCLEASPGVGVKLFKEPPGRLRYLSPEEADKLLGACSPELEPVVTTALNAGARLGEILALDWDHVDLKRRQLRVVDSKNNETRVVPINDILYNTLKMLGPKNGKVFKSGRGQAYRSVSCATLLRLGWRWKGCRCRR